MECQISKRRSLIAVLLFSFVALAWVGCSSTIPERRGETDTRGMDVNVGRYYYFDDVLVPTELNYKPGRSFIYETPQLKTGSMIIIACGNEKRFPDW